MRHLLAAKLFYFDALPVHLSDRLALLSAGQLNAETLKCKVADELGKRLSCEDSAKLAHTTIDLLVDGWLCRMCTGLINICIWVIDQGLRLWAQRTPFRIRCTTLIVLGPFRIRVATLIDSDCFL